MLGVFDMAEDLNRSDESAFAKQVAAKAARKLKARREGDQGVWSGLETFGAVGWSVAVPTILGAMLGRWWDGNHPGGHSWTLPLLAAGLVIGCANAWRWMAQEDKDD